MNPYEVENVADTLSRALEMPKDERQLRMFQVRTRSMHSIYNRGCSTIYKEKNLKSKLRELGNPQKRKRSFLVARPLRRGDKGRVTKKTFVETCF